MGSLGGGAKVVKSREQMKETAAGVFLPGSSLGQGSFVLAKKMPG